MVYCHEYLSDRWSYHPYVDHLRDLGFDVFTFDFRNHGESEREPGYEPMQWTTDREVRDLRAALEHTAVAARSRSGGLRPLRREPGRNDGAWSRPPPSPTSGAWSPTAPSRPTGRWSPTSSAGARFMCRNPLVRSLLPRWSSAFWPCRRGGRPSVAELPVPQRRSGRRQAGAAALADDPRRARLVHQPRDRPGSVPAGQEFKELWLVPKAKHNRCREADPEGYVAGLLSFLERFAPRRPWLAQPAVSALAAMPATSTISGRRESSPRPMSRPARCASSRRGLTASTSGCQR